MPIIIATNSAFCAPVLDSIKTITTQLEVIHPIPPNLDRAVPDSITPSVNFPLSDSIAEKKTFAQKLQQKKNTPYLIAGSAVAIGGGIYYLMHKAWWTQKSRSFHIDRDRDYKYANNLDKLGHFQGGLWAADFYNSIFNNMGYTKKQSGWYALAMTAGFQTLIEIKDGFSPHWGFSIGDVSAGALGGLWIVGKQHSEFIHQTDFKFSYWVHSTKYFEITEHKVPFFHADDYLNQTYWFSTPINYLTANKIKGLPDWLNLSVGFGIDADTWSNKVLGEGGKWELFFAPDINLEKLFKPKKAFWKTVVHAFNYIKFPMPTIQMGPYKPRYHWVYF